MPPLAKTSSRVAADGQLPLVRSSASKRADPGQPPAVLFPPLPGNLPHRSPEVGYRGGGGWGDSRRGIQMPSKKRARFSGEQSALTHYQPPKSNGGVP